MRMLEGGSVDITSFRLCRVQLIKPDQNADVFVIQVNNTASCKSLTYITNIVLSADPHFKFNGAYFGDRISRCTCPNGRLLCSHMATTLCVLQLIQLLDDSSASQFLRAFPQPIRLTSQFFIAISYVYNKGVMWKKMIIVEKLIRRQRY